MAENFVDRLNGAIQEFVSSPENARLKRGTGSYSTPFRGTLFGETESVKVDAISQHTPVDVLWMGSNPNVPQSLQAILGGDGDASDYDTFVRQRDCGKFSEQLFLDGAMSGGWDPIHYPVRRGWQFYSRLFGSVGDIHRVAMANFVVWGSQTFDDLLSKLAAADDELIQRVLDFSVQLNREIVKQLRPAIIVVPFSLGANSRLHKLISTDLAMGAASRPYAVQTRKRRFMFRVHEEPAALPSVRILHVPHPSSLRLDSESAEMALSKMQEALGKLR